MRPAPVLGGFGALRAVDSGPCKPFDRARRGLNLSKLESRPSRGAAWEYVFWADLDGSVDDPSIAEALAELRTTSTMVRVLGSYPRAGEP